MIIWDKEAWNIRIYVKMFNSWQKSANQIMANEVNIKDLINGAFDLKSKLFLI